MTNGEIPMRISQVAPVQPVASSANTEAFVRDHLAAQSDKTEVDGVKLDMIPFVGDGAILLDDVPEPVPEPVAKLVEEPALSLPASIVQAKATDENPEIDDTAKTDAAEQAYHDEREISQVPKPVDDKTIDHVDPENQTAGSADKAPPPLDLVV